MEWRERRMKLLMSRHGKKWEGMEERGKEWERMEESGHYFGAGGHIYDPKSQPAIYFSSLRP